MRPYLKKPITKKGWWSGSRCYPEFKHLYHTHTHTKKKLQKPSTVSRRKNQGVADQRGSMF
jgi:hypothetical protein